VHSLLKLPIGARGNKDLTGQSLCGLQESVNNIGYIIIDEYSMLGQVVFLAKGARVMLIMNLWSSVGLCNGANGTVVDIIYQNNHQPPDLPIAVIVEFENYRGPIFNESRPLCIPIYPITVTSQTEIGFHERQQLPLRLAWALTIHKSQGLALPKAWIDIGKSERTAGVS
jgi:ATP-dependent exoDNAse (exonuclease V) alpha subunit